MTILFLRLVGPLQAWGVKSRFTVRSTELEPSKSDIIGMLTAAVGRCRTDPAGGLLSLRFGVRKDQPDRVIRGFHTVNALDGKDSMPLSNRYYLVDAVFLADIEGDRPLLEGIDKALHHPAFPLYLGRRSYPPTPPVPLDLREAALLDALRAGPWLASLWFQRRHRSHVFNAELLLDQETVPIGERDAARGSRDIPVSFDPRRRDYDFRQVRRVIVQVGVPRVGARDPILALEEAN